MSSNLDEIVHDDMEWKGIYTHEFGPPTIIIDARLYGYPKELTDLRKWIYDNYRI